MKYSMNTRWPIASILSIIPHKCLKNGLPLEPNCKARRPCIRLDLQYTPNKINGDNDACSTMGAQTTLPPVSSARQHPESQTVHLRHIFKLCCGSYKQLRNLLTEPEHSRNLVQMPSFWTMTDFLLICLCAQEQLD